MSSDGDPKFDLDDLVAALSVAQSLAADLASDPIIARFLRVIRKIDPADRAVIVGVLERDTTWCRIVDQTGDATGITVRANPHASLYVHVIDGVDAPSEPLRRDIDVIRTGIERFLYLAPLLLQDGVRAQWLASARELARDAAPELRTAVAAIAREVLAVIAAADGAPDPQTVPVVSGTPATVRNEAG